jgi:hypothetical protein
MEKRANPQKNRLNNSVFSESFRHFYSAKQDVTVSIIIPNKCLPANSKINNHQF